MSFNFFSWPNICLGIIAYYVAVAIYRLYLSPLAKFPGPKLAALTSWYEFYYDIVLQGRYVWKIAELHEQYGFTTLLESVIYEI